MAKQEKLVGTLGYPVRTMRNAIKFASRDAKRPILCAVHLDERGDVVATDSYRMFASGMWEGPSINIDYATAHDISKCKLKGNETAEVEVVGTDVTVRMGDGTEIKGATVEGKYPNYEKLFEVKHQTVAYVNVKEALPVIREHARNKRNVIVEVHNRDLYIFGAGEPEPAYRKEKEGDGQDVRIGFDAAYLRDCLQAMGEYAEIRIEGPLKPAVITWNEGTDLLLMPVRTDGGTKEPKVKKAPAKPKGWKEAPKAPEPVTDEKIVSLKGERVCITGTLPGMSRSEAFTRLKLAGGVPCEKFSGKVTLFVVAANAGRDKRDKAEKAIAKGQKLKVVSGSEFVRALNEQGKTAGERKQEERMAKKEESKHEEKKPITVECFGRKFYASHNKGEFITPGGPKERVSFEVGKAYRYREGGHEYAAASLGYDVYKGQKKCLFAVFENGEWKGYLRTMAWAKLKAMANNPIDEPRKLTKPPVKAEEKPKQAPKPPAKPKEDVEMKKRIEELEAELKATRKELDEVWKENANLKAKPQAPKAKQEDAAAVVSLESMTEWCEGKGLKAKQTNERSSIWILGPSKPYKDELIDMGARWGTSKKYGKGWYIEPSAA